MVEYVRMYGCIKTEMHNRTRIADVFSYNLCALVFFVLFFFLTNLASCYRNCLIKKKRRKEMKIDF